MSKFSGEKDQDQNIGELVLETLLNSRINTIIFLNLSKNFSWFWHPVTNEERFENVNLMSELISK